MSPILSEHVEAYLHGLRPGRSPVMSEMEAVAERDGVPIVHWETGRLLAAICRALDPVVLEVGTAIGYSTLHIAEQLERGRVVTLEIDPARAAQARDFLSTCCSWTRLRASTGSTSSSPRGTFRSELSS
jgi:predicted O-methyltransferase YrrM